MSLDGPCRDWLDVVYLALLTLNMFQVGVTTHIAKRQRRAERERAELIREVRAGLAADVLDRSERSAQRSGPSRT